MMSGAEVGLEVMTTPLPPLVPLIGPLNVAVPWKLPIQLFVPLSRIGPELVPLSNRSAPRLALIEPPGPLMIVVLGFRVFAPALMVSVWPVPMTQVVPAVGSAVADVICTED